MRTLTLILIGLVFAIPAHATTCNAQISAITPLPVVAYDPFDNVARSADFEVEFTNNGPDSCNLSLAVASQQPGSTRHLENSGAQLRYVVEKPGGDDYANNIAAPQGSITLKGGAGKVKSITLRIKVPRGLIAPAAMYSDTLRFRTYQAGTAIQMGPERTAFARAAVEARAQVNIAGTSSSNFGSFGIDQIDFGTLDSNETREAAVQVRATRSVAISISSQHHGKLKHKALSAAPGVPYSMRIEGENVTLSGAPFVLLRAPPASLDGANYRMQLRIGDTSSRPAGNYQDMLTITVSPQ